MEFALEDLKKRAADKLIYNLEDLVKSYRQVLELVRKEKDLLLNADLEALNENNDAKEKIVLKLRSLDGLRVKYAGELARLVGVDEADARLLELARKLETAESDRLRSQHAALDLLIKRVKELNSENAQYAESALGQLNGAMNNIKETVVGKKTYGPKGKMQSGQNATAGNFVSKAR